MKGQFGKAKVVQVLRGSRAKDILEYRLDRLSTQAPDPEQLARATPLPEQSRWSSETAALPAGYARAADDAVAAATLRTPVDGLAPSPGVKVPMPLLRNEHAV